MKPFGNRLSIVELCYNVHVASVRIIVERRCFWREVMLWSYMARQVKRSEEKYNVISELWKASTNFHLMHNPFQFRDGLAYSNYRQRLYEKGVLKHDKSFEFQQQYRDCKRQNLMDQLQSLRRVFVFSDEKFGQFSDTESHVT